MSAAREAAHPVQEGPSRRGGYSWAH